MIEAMSDSGQFPPKTTRAKAPLSLGLSIVLAIILTFVVVSLFGLIVFLFVQGAQQLGLSRPAYLAIFVVISGIFAWVLKRLTDIAAGMSRFWFPEDSDDKN
jgi:hypothetical protein